MQEGSEMEVLEGERTAFGKIIRGVGGFYYVDVTGEGVYECRARGIFRKEKIKPLVGDNVRICIQDDRDMEGSVDEILPRHSQLIRPAAANIDQVLLIIAAADPKPNFNLLDRFLIYMHRQDIPVTILLNKADLVEKKCLEEYASWYSNSGSDVLCASILRGDVLEEVLKRMEGKTTMLAGPSGVGKSSLTNRLVPDAAMEVGEISRKIRRGKQTTRHTQIHRIGENAFLLDTPGFSSLFLPEMTQAELQECYPEFARYEEQCRFQGCAHINEPECAVKEALEKGEIARIRYENYRMLLEELRSMRRY